MSSKGEPHRCHGMMLADTTPLQTIPSYESCPFTHMRGQPTCQVSQVTKAANIFGRKGRTPWWEDCRRAPWNNSDTARSQRASLMLFIFPTKMASESAGAEISLPRADFCCLGCELWRRRNSGARWRLLLIFARVKAVAVSVVDMATGCRCCNAKQ